jgi:signal transduction histidine kinase
MLTTQPDRPFRLLLYLEWLMLALAAISSILPTPHNPTIAISRLTLISIVLFGLMGLWIPTKRISVKVLYLVLEFGILLLPILMNDRIQFIPFLGVVLLIRSCQMFKLPGRLVVTALAYGTLVSTAFLQESNSPQLFLKALENGDLTETIPTESTILLLKLNATLAVGLLLIFVLLLVNSLLSERQSRQKLAIAHEQLRQYAHRIEDQATLQERNRIAREIHDSLGHVLTAQSIQLENALLFCKTDTIKTKHYLLTAQQLGSTALQDVRQSISTLRSNPLQEISLKTAIAHTINEFRAITGISPTCRIDILSDIPIEINTTIHRIIQEAFTNIYKHSAASQVHLDLCERMGALVLHILDNGRGFCLDQNTSGFGIQGMRERALTVGGQFTLTSEPGKGCTVEVVVPLLSRLRVEEERIAPL